MKLRRSKTEFKIPKEILPMEGFDNQIDKLFVRMIQLEVEESIWLLVSIDITSLKETFINNLRKLIAKRYNINIDNIWISVTHTFSVPHISNDFSKDNKQSEKSRLLFASLMVAVENAIEQLHENYIEVTPFFAKGNTQLGLNRNLWTNSGWWLGPNESGKVASEINSIVFKDPENRIQGRIVQVSIPSSITQDVNNHTGKPISGDLFGQTASLLEADETVCILLLGQAADQMPRDKIVYETVDKEGLRIEVDRSEMAEKVLAETSNRLKEDIQKIDEHLNNVDERLNIHTYSFQCNQQYIPRLSELKPDTRYQFKNIEDKKDFPVFQVKIGELNIIGIQAEVPACFKENISFFEQELIIATMINGGAKYLVPKEWYHARKYQAMNSIYAEGSYEKIILEIQSILNESRERK